MTRRALHGALLRKDDEFYTQRETIEAELRYYKRCFKGKIVYCNCDRIDSEFYKYFDENFKKLGLKKLYCSSYSDADLFNEAQPPQIAETSYDATGYKGGSLRSPDGNGSFDSKESIELLKKADIVVTNPPFSLFRKFITLLLKYNKDFLIMGTPTDIKSKNVLMGIKDGRIKCGVNFGKFDFKRPNGGLKRAESCWFTTLDKNTSINRIYSTGAYRKHINYNENYTADKYRRYVNYDAIDVPTCGVVPVDYNGVMGVPITAPLRLDISKYDIIGLGQHYSVSEGFVKLNDMEDLTTLSGKQVKYDGVLLEYDPELDKTPSCKGVETGRLYKQPFLRILIRGKK